MMNQLTEMPTIQSQTEFDKSHEPLYTSLDDTIPQIRLVKVNFRQPDEASETMIKCSMETLSLHEVENQYLALSYAWENAKDRKSIIINNHQHLVTVNLEAFLQEWRDSAFRNHNDQVYDSFLWIDAVCINQDDLLERKSQVMLMSKIYSSARSTLSWLGRGSDSCEYGLESILILGEHVKDLLEEDDRANCLTEEAWPTRFCLRHANAKGFFKNFAWDGIYDLFRVEYWVRAWVQQEIALAKDIVFWYGKIPASMSHMRSVREWLDRIKNQNCPDFFHPAVWKHASRKEYRSLLGIDNHLLRLGYLQRTIKDHTITDTPPLIFRLLYTSLVPVQSTDPRDLLYSLLGVVDLGIQADYELTIEEVYYRFAKIWMMKPCGLIFLLGAGGPCPIPSHHSEPNHCSLPSWAPCWISLKSGFPRIGVDMSLEANSGADIRRATVKITGRCLQIRGYILSRIKWDKSINAENLESFLTTYLYDPMVTLSTLGLHR